MTEIIRDLIKWTEENKIFPSIYFRTYENRVYCYVRFEKDNKAISHMFNASDWDRFPMDDEVKFFIKEAKYELLGEDTPEPVNCCEDRTKDISYKCNKCSNAFCCEFKEFNKIGYCKHFSLRHYPDVNVCDKCKNFTDCAEIVNLDPNRNLACRGLTYEKI